MDNICSVVKQQLPQRCSVLR